MRLSNLCVPVGQVGHDSRLLVRGKGGGIRSDSALKQRPARKALARDASSTRVVTFRSSLGERSRSA